MQSHLSAILNLAIGAILAAPTVASAAGFALLEQSASRLGTAFAGMAAADDATTVFFNPAGLLDFDRREALAIASGIEITSEFHDQGSRSALGQPVGLTAATPATGTSCQVFTRACPSTTRSRSAWVSTRRSVSSSCTKRAGWVVFRR